MEYMEQKMQELLDSALHEQEQAELNEAMHTGDYTKPDTGWFYPKKYYD